MKRYESFENNILKSWPNHPTHSQLRRVELSNTDESELYNSESWSIQFNVQLDGVHIKILWFECVYGQKEREGYRIVCFLDGKKAINEFINFKDEAFYEPRDLVSAFVWGK